MLGWGMGRVEALAVRNEIIDLLDQGYPVATIYRQLIKSGRVTMGRAAFYQNVAAIRRDRSRRAEPAVVKPSVEDAQKSRPDTVPAQNIPARSALQKKPAGSATVSEDLPKPPIIPVVRPAQRSERPDQSADIPRPLVPFYTEYARVKDMGEDSLSYQIAVCKLEVAKDFYDRGLLEIPGGRSGEIHAAAVRLYEERYREGKAW